MQISECTTYINRRGELRFMMPGFRRSIGGISQWNDGFEPCQIRNGSQSDSKHWSLNMLSENRGRRLDGTVQSFIDQIPRDVRERVACYRFGQIAMLQCIACYPEANDLSLSNPKLFWLLIASTFDSDWTVEDIHRVCQFRQVDILERINGHASKATVRLLHRIEITDGTLGEARNILRAISQPEIVRVAAHQQIVTVRYLALLSNYPDLAEPAAANVLGRVLISEAGRSPGTAVDMACRLVDIKRMARILGIARPGQAMSECKSVEDVNRLHDRWVENLNGRTRTEDEESAEIEQVLEHRPEFDDIPAFLRQQNRNGDGQRPIRPQRRIPRRIILRERRTDISSLTFPPAPFPDSKHIEAISTVDELIDEGRAQENCVASYAETVAEGDTYIYRVLKPQRGTLELRRLDSAWVLGQFKLKRNAAPGKRARAAVDKWYQKVAWTPQQLQR